MEKETATVHTFLVVTPRWSSSNISTRRVRDEVEKVITLLCFFIYLASQVKTKRLN